MTRNNPTLYRLPLAIALALLWLSASGCKTSSAPPRHVAVAMKKYAITPAEIRLKQGETVEFEVSTADVQHGFTVPTLGINEPVNPGRPATFTFRAKTRGKFTVECGIICGFGHDDMRATIIIE